MKIKVSEATPIQLDWMVAKCEGETLSQASIEFQIKEHGCLQRPHLGNWNPTTSWVQGGPIIFREKICVICPSTGAFWDARLSGFNSTYHRGPTLLIAAMRCYVSSKLGEEVEIPEELCK